jgi:hypothetical protein
LLRSLQWDKLLAWVKNHAIKVQGRHATKKGTSHLLSNSLLIVSTDIVKAITTALKAEQPRKEEIEAIISEVSVPCCSSSIYSYIPFSANPNTTQGLLHSSPLFNTFTSCTADSEATLTGGLFFYQKKIYAYF